MRPSRGKAGRFNRGRRSHVNASTSESVFLFSIHFAKQSPDSPPRLAASPATTRSTLCPRTGTKEVKADVECPRESAGIDDGVGFLFGERNRRISGRPIAKYQKSQKILSRENMSNRNADLSRLLLLPSFRPFPDLASPARRCKG